MNDKPIVARIVFATLAVALAATGLALAQSAKPHRIVFEVTGDGEAAWTAVLNNVTNAREALGANGTEIRVIAHGKGIGLVRTADASLAPRIAALSGAKVRFFACENTMKRLDISKADLLPGVGTVDSGVAEVVRLQEAGWSYLKSGS